MRRLKFLSFVSAALATFGLAPAMAAADTITGAGSSFDFPFFSVAFYQYHEDHDSVNVNYQSIGSGGGIQQFTAKTVDFGASDVPLNGKEMAAAVAANGEVVQVPVTLGGVVIAFNIPGISTHIKLTPDVLSAIYLGDIANWNDPRIAKLNSGVSFPDMPIVVGHRADASGTTYIFTDYLSKVSGEWATKVGNAKSVNWPAPSAIGAKGNEGVAAMVRSTPGAIGYIELAYALQNQIPYAALQNREGEFVVPSVETVRNAAAQKPHVSPANFSIVDQPGRDSYPIAGYSWVMIWKNPPDQTKGKQLLDLLRWLVTGGQTQAAQVKYVSLPPNVQAEAEHALASVHS